MDDIFSFGKFIADKRKKLRITLRGMAAELGIAPAYLSDMKKAEDIRWIWIGLYK